MSYLNEFIEKLSSIKIGTLALWSIVKVLVLSVVLLFIVKCLLKIISKVLSKTTLDKTIQNIISGICRFALYFFAIIMVAEQLGIPSTSFIAVLGTAGLAFSLALQDSLSNIAGGMLLLYTNPFSSGDFIEAEGASGTVEQIGFIHTSLFTLDNKKIYIPNGKLSKDLITNFSTQPMRQLEIIFPISYTADVQLAKNIVSSSVKASSLIDHTAEPFIRVWNLGDSTVDIICRVWATKDNLLEAKCALLEDVKIQFGKAGFATPNKHINVNMN